MATKKKAKLAAKKPALKKAKQHVSVGEHIPARKAPTPDELRRLKRCVTKLEKLSHEHFSVLLQQHCQEINAMILRNDASIIYVPDAARFLLELARRAGHKV